MSELRVEERAPRFAAWLAEPMRANRRTYLKVAVAAALINLFGVFTSLFSMIVYDRVVPNNALDSLTALTIGLLLVLSVDFVLKLLRAYFVDIAGADIDGKIGAAVFERLLAMRMELRQGSAGAMSGLVRELETLREFFASATIIAMIDVPFMLLTLLVIALIGKWLVLVFAVTIPLVLLAAWLTNPIVASMAARNLQEGLGKQAILVETIAGIETVKTAGAGAMLTERWRGAVSRHADSSLRQRLVASIAITIAGSATTLSYSAIVVAGVYMIASQQLTMGGLIACSLLSSRAISPIGQIAHLLTRLSATRTAYAQLNAMIAQPVEGPSGTPLFPTALRGEIELRDVRFRYPGADQDALKGVSIKIAAGERVALVGPVGSGKSTIVRLLLGLYPAGDGLVMIDGTDIRQYDPAALRALIGSALQDNALFSGTVRDNIALGRRRADEDEVRRAATVSGTHGFLSAIPNGYDLRLADRGEGLSGGQRQSIVMARAIAGAPQIYVFDEPTSAMDGQTEAGMVARLASELEGRTLVLVTHRPSLLQLVDRVVVLDQGTIKADGPRDQITKVLMQPRAAA